MNLHESYSDEEMIEGDGNEIIPADADTTPEAVLDARQTFNSWETRLFGAEDSTDELLVTDPTLLPPEALEVYNKRFTAD